MDNQSVENQMANTDTNKTDIKKVQFHGRFFISIARNKQINFGVSNIYVAIILHFLVFWTTFNERIGNNKAFIDNKYWVRISASKLSKDLEGIVSAKHIYRTLQGLINIGFIEVHKSKAGSANTAYQYRPTSICYDYLSANDDLNWAIYEARQYADYKKGQTSTTQSTSSNQTDITFENYFKHNRLF